MKRKKIIYTIGLLIITALFLFAFQNGKAEKQKDYGQTDTDHTILVGEDDQNKYDETANTIVEAINMAVADYETTTTIVLTENATLNEDIPIKSGQNIKIVSEDQDVEIGVTNLGYTLTINNKISIDRQASLTFEINTVLNGMIYASEDNPEDNVDFNGEVYIKDSLTLNGDSATLNTSKFKNIEVSGAINLIKGKISGNGTIEVSKEAGIIQTAGTYEDTVKFMGEGLFITTKTTAPNGLKSIKGASTLGTTTENKSFAVTSGTYILTSPDYEIGTNLAVDGELNIFSALDTKITISSSAQIQVSNNDTLNIGGISLNNEYYSAGTNQIIIDGGAEWQDDSNGNYYFVTDSYEAGITENSKVETYGRSCYSASYTSNMPMISVNGDSTANLAIYRGVTLQNRINNVKANENSTSLGGAIGLVGSANNLVKLTINGANIKYNALTNVTNSGGGAGVAAKYGNINFKYGAVNYNTLLDDSNTDQNSADGAGIALVNNSTLTMEEGSKVSYNHGDKDFDADGGGIMVRDNSNLTINGGEVSYNFTYGFGGGICVYSSPVNIDNGLVYGNRSTYGGGIATSGTSTVTLGEINENSNLEVAFNTAFIHPNSKTSGYGGGVSLGNNGANDYLYNQKLIVNAGQIHNNTAIYGGGISNYSTGENNNNQLQLNGGIVSDNKANSSNQGDGIYAINTSGTGSNPLILMSGGIQVSTSNNIVFAGLTSTFTEGNNSANVPISDDNTGWDLWEGTNNSEQKIGDMGTHMGTLVAESMNVGSDRSDNYVNFYDDENKNNYNGYFEITPTRNIKFTFRAIKDNLSTDSKNINVYIGSVLYDAIEISRTAINEREYSINLYANMTYRFQLANNTNNGNVNIYSLDFKELNVNNISQTPIRVTNQLTASGIIGLISYSDLVDNTILATYSVGQAQADKFIIDDANYRIETNNTNVIIRRNENNAIAKVGQNPFSSLNEAISYITDEKKYNSKTATIEIINNVNLTANDFITIPRGYNITIKSEGNNTYTLNIPSNIGSVSNKTLFTIEPTASLTLDNIEIEGNSTQSAGYLVVENNGIFTLNKTAAIKNNLGMKDYASVIEIGRGDTKTNIYGSIYDNIGDYGAIYLSNSEAVVNIYDGAIINNNRYTGDTKGLENLTTVDIFIENGSLDISNFNGEIGTIVKQGSGNITANNLSNTTPIGVKLNGNNYERNKVVVEVTDNTDYSNKFELLEPQDDRGYDSLIKESDGYDIVLNMILTIEISYEDIWEAKGNNTYGKVQDIENVEIFDNNFNSLEKLKALANRLGHKYDIDYHAGKSTLLFYIDSTSQLVFTTQDEKDIDLSNLATRSGYHINGYVRHNLNDEVSETFYGLESFISVQNFTNTTSHIYLGTVWTPNSYIIEFNNGGLSTALGSMGNQEIAYNAFENINDLPMINTNLYYAIGFYFKGWKIKSTNGYVLDSNGKDLVIIDESQLDEKTLNLILNQVNPNSSDSSITFVFVATWGSIFGNANIEGNHFTTGTINDPFIISDAAGIKALADTVSLVEDSYTVNNYKYYNQEGRQVVKTNYAGYYFELDSSINLPIEVANNLVIGNITDRGKDFFESSESEKPIADMEILNNSSPFSGNFDGNNKTISVNINDKNNIDFVGLFGYTKDATITNLTVTGSVNGRISVGGIIGLAYGGNYRNLTNEATISYNGINAGGIMGTYYIESQNYRNGSINNVVNKAKVKYVPEADDPKTTDVIYGPTWAENEILFAYQGTRAGGIVGQSFHVNITEAYNSGDIEARLGVGGIIGTMISQNDETREDSALNIGFNAGNITATAGIATTYEYNGKTESIYQVNAYVGGIVGRMFGASTLNNAMNIGSVKASWIGTYEVNDNIPTFTYDDQKPTIGGRGVGGIVGVTSIDLTVEQMQDPSTRASEQQGGNKTVSNVINAGKVSGWTHVGGIAGILAYSDLSYAINVGSLTATGVHYEDDKAVVGAFSYDVIDGENSYYNFLGGLIGLGVSANVNSTSVFDGDLAYTGYTDSIIQAIGDKEEAIAIGYDTNNDNALKLASSHLICQPSNKQPVGLDSTFFQTGWIWKSYDEDPYYYYPQLVSFANSSKTICLEDTIKTVSQLSKEAVRLTDIYDKPVDETHKVTITLELGNGSINYDGSITTTDGAVFELKAGVWQTTINYLEYRGDGLYKMLNLDSLTDYLTLQAYDFAGWYRDSKFTEEFNGVVSSNDEVLYAKWVPTKYTITLTGVQKYANGDVQIAGSNLITYDIEDVEAKKEFVLPGIVNNKAYRFSYWEISSEGKTYNATSLSIEQNEDGTYQVRLYLNNTESGNFRITELGTLDFTLVCEAINYQIKYQYIDNKDNSKIDSSDSTTIQTTFNINSNFDLEEPNIAGYVFENFYYNDKTYHNISEIIALGFDDLDPNTPIDIKGKYNRAKYTISLILNNGTFNNIDSGNIIIGDKKYQIKQAEDGLWQIINIEYKEDISFLWQKDDFNKYIFNKYIIAPAGSEFIGLSSSNTTSEGKYDKMPSNNINVYAKYDVTTYEITLDAGYLGDKPLSFKEEDADISDLLEYNSDDKLILKATYGSDISGILEQLVKILVTRELENSNYNFNSFVATYQVDSETKNFSYYNVRIDEENYSNIKIEFIFKENVYNIAIFDNLGNYITNYSSDADVDWLDNGNINISKFREYLRGLNYELPAGYNFNNHKFTIRINNELAYDVDDSKETILVNGYTVISIILEPKEYTIKYQDSNGNLYETAPTADKLIYNGQVNTSDLYQVTQPGYNFIGWQYNGEFLGKTFIPTEEDINGNKIILKAVFEEASYKITFEFNADTLWGGVIPRQEITVVYGDEDINLANYFNLEGYNFGSASYNENTIHEINKDFLELEELAELREITITIDLEIEKLHVTFSAGDGDFEFNRNDLNKYTNSYYLTEPDGEHIKEKPSDTVILKYFVVEINYFESAARYLPTNPIKVGSSFSNWSSQTSGVVLQQQLKEDTTFNANYVKDKYTITLINDGEITTIDNLVYGQTYNLSTPAKDGYTFEGWYDVETDIKVEQEYQVTKNVVLEAKYDPKNYELTINTTESTIQNAILDELKNIFGDNLTWNSGKFSIPYGTDLTDLNGLIIEENKAIIFTLNNEAYSFGNMPAEDLTITAETTDSSEYITIKGTISGFADNESKEITFIAVKGTDGKYYISSYENLVFEGYTFDNKWSINGSAIDDDITEYGFEDNNTNITANVERIDLTISITNVDSYGEDEYTAYYGETVKEFLKRNELGDPTRPGYAFTGWSYYGDDYKITANITLEANYDAVNYFIEYVDENGEKVEKVSVAYGEEIGTLPSIQKEVYEYLTYVVYGTNISYEVIFPNGVMVDLSELMNGYRDAITKDVETGNITVKIQIKKNEKTFILNVIGSNVSGNSQTAKISFKYSDSSINITADSISHYDYLGLANSLDGVGDNIISGVLYNDLIQLFEELDLNNNNQEVRVDVYFIYEAIEYSISFAGYSELTDLPFTCEYEYVAIPTGYVVKKEGKIFNGWEVNGKVYKDAFYVEDLLKALTDSKTSITVTANFTTLTYDVLFYYNDEVYSLENIEYGTTYAELYGLFNGKYSNLVDLDKIGYNFDGWYDYQGNKLIETNNTNQITKFMTFSPKFTPITYTIEFNSNDGNGSMGSLSLTYDEAVKLTNNSFTRYGYSFIGWSTEVDGDVLYTNCQRVINLTTEDNDVVTLYAVWEANEYTITFNTDGGSAINSINFNVENKNDIDLTDYVPTKLGYDFVGWYLDGNKIDSISELKDYNLTAQWQAKTYNITYENAEITNINEFNTYKYDEELKLPELDDVTPRDGYTFIGWNYNTKEEIAKNADKENNITLTAKWQANKYTISYYVNGEYGSVNGEESITVDYDEVITLPSVNANSGFTFMYWSLNGTYYTAGTKVSKLTTETNVTLKAVFSYEITFNCNGGEGLVDPITGLIEDEINGVVLPNNGFVRTHYIFVGWSTKPNPSAADKNYQPGELYKDLDKPLYAIWKAESYTITYQDENGKKLGTSTYTYNDENITLLDLPKILGYDVDGWYYEENIFKYSQGLFGDINLSYKKAPKEITTTINISGLDTVLEWLKSQIEAKDTNNSLTIEINGDKLIITLTSTYGEDNRDIINQIFSNNYLYEDEVSGVTYTLYPITINEVVPTKAETYNYSFTKTSIVVNLYGVYGHYDMGEEPTSNIITLGQYEVNNANFILSEDDIKPYLKDIYGYSFARWYFISDLDKAESFDFTKPITESIDLYAEYDANLFSITYDNDNIINTHYDANLTIKEAASKPGYKFIGYALSPNGLVVLNTGDSVNKAYDLMNKEGNNITLYPIYESYVLTIEFNGNNASGNMPDLTFAYNEFNINNLSDISSGYYKEGYSFAGWTYVLDGTEYNSLEKLREPLNNAFADANVTITLKANWKVNTYTIIYVDADMESTKHGYASRLNLDSPTRRVGYTFAGWYLDSNHSKEFNYDTMPAKDLILYAKWNPISYNVVFNSNGGFGTMNSLPLNYDEPKKLTKNSFTREGYKFIGWSTEANGSIVYNDEDTVINLTETSSKIILYAVWETDTYTVIFNGNGGIGNMDNQLFAYGETKELTKNSFTREGYKFIGWSTSRDGNAVYKDCSNINIKADTTLYAVWEANTYTIDFKLDSSLDIEVELPKSVEIEYNASFNLTELNVTGYRFIGWYYEEQQIISGMPYTYSEDITLIARFELDQYNIYFDMNGGNPIASMNVAYGQNVKLTTTPTRVGYTFAGFSYNNNTYYLAEDLTIEGFTVPQTDATLKAIWEANTYTITLNDGGELTNDKIEVTYDSPIGIDLVDPTRTGYAFIGWFDSDNKRVTKETIYNYANDITLTAQWEAMTYVITYETIGGSTINEVLEMTYDKPSHITNTIPTRRGYNFLGFATTPNAEEAIYNSGQEVTNILFETSNKTLYAVWEAKTYTISYQGYSNTQTFSYNEVLPELLEVSLEGNTFISWYYNNIRVESGQLLGTLLTDEDEKDLNITLVPRFEKNSYIVSFDTLGGTNIEAINVTYGDSINIDNPTKTGYNFISWQIDGDDVDLVTYKMPDHNVKLVARYEIVEYNISYVGTDYSHSNKETYTVKDVVEFEDATKVGYTFAGWYLDSKFETRVTSTLDYAKDLVLYAKFEVITYNISYSLDGGTNANTNPNSYTVEDVVEFEDATKVGYTFAGWYLDSKFETRVTSTSDYAKDLVLYAKFEVITYTITLGEDEIKYTVEKVVELPVLTKPGYEFGGWLIADEARFNTIDLVGNYNGSAIWTLLEYNISYSLDGGTNANTNPNSYTVEDVVEFEDATKVGYTFAGWYLDSKFETRVTSTSDYAKDLVLYAKFEVITYTITFDTSDTSLPKFEDVEIAYGETLGSKLPNVDVPFGTTFDYWYYTNSENEDVVVTKDFVYNLTTNITLKPKVYDTTYYFIYNLDGGINNDSNIFEITLPDLNEPKELYNPTKVGYKFVGWYLDSEMTIEVVQLTKEVLEYANNKNQISLYAKYEIETYTIKYLDNDKTTVLKETEMQYNTLAEIFTPTKDGYIFDAWLKEDGKRYDFNTPITGDLVLIAGYRKESITYTLKTETEDVVITVQSIDGKGLPADAKLQVVLVKHEIDATEAIDLLANIGTINRLYDIKLVDSAGTIIEPNGEVRVTLTLPDGKFPGDGKEYKIMYINNDYSNYEEYDCRVNTDGLLEFYTTHFSYYAIVTVDKVIDYTWLWIVLGVLGLLLIQAIIVIIVKNRKYKITFISNGNIKVKDMRYKKDENVILPIPERLGYKFVGWYLDSKYTHPANIKTMPNENIILYARWKEDPITIGLVVKNKKTK